jgi:hypothetical protein
MILIPAVTFVLAFLITLVSPDEAVGPSRSWYSTFTWIAMTIVCWVLAAIEMVKKLKGQDIR